MVRYRPDIDGLRGVAVLVVVFFHLVGAPFTGGYVGVDVFFVISGFLITSILVEDIVAGKFSVARFYERRVRRLFPALFATLIGATTVAFFLLTPDDFRRFGIDVASAVAFVANFIFYKQVNYFSAPEDNVALIHLWSLSVEEQFYLVFPFFLVGVHRWLKGRFILSAGIVGGLSYALTVWGLDRYPAATFYLLPMRAWELMMGAVMALDAFPQTRLRVLREILGAAGLALIAWGVLDFGVSVGVPGQSPLLPCIGAGLLIYAGNDGECAVRAMLSWRPLVAVGLMSYSLYLWHWPIIAFAHLYAIRDFKAYEIAAIFAASMLIAAVSYRFIELPFRRRTIASTRRGLFQAAASVMLLVGCAGFAIYALQGMPGRLRPAVNVLAGGILDRWPGSARCFAGAAPDDVTNARLCDVGAADAAAPSFVVWGDSHADALMPGIELSARAHRVKGIDATMPGCPPLVGLRRYPFRSPATAACVDFNRRVLDLILRSRSLGTIILIGFWNGYLPTSPEAAQIPLLEDLSPGGNTRDQFGMFRASLERTVASLAATGKRVVVVDQVPSAKVNVPRALATAMLLDRQVDIRPNLAAFEEETRFVRKTLADLHSTYGVEILRPAEFLCDTASGKCAVERDGHALYRDADHLNATGGRLVRHMFDPMFGTPNPG